MSSSDMNSVCSLYLAPSSIPNAGMGIFTTRFIAKGSSIYRNRIRYLSPFQTLLNDSSDNSHQQQQQQQQQQQNDDEPESISLPIFDFEYHGQQSRQYAKDEFRLNETLFDDYYWGSTGTTLDFESYDIMLLVPGIGMMLNFHPYQMNAKEQEFSGSWTSHTTNQVSDYEAGVISSHDSIGFKATKDIQPGEELFADYGDYWLDYREYDSVPRLKDYQQAARILVQLHTLMQENLGGDEQMNRTLDVPATKKLLSERFSKRVLSLIPDTVSELHHLFSKCPFWQSPTMNITSLTNTSTHSNTNQKSKNDTEEEHKCLKLLEESLAIRTLEQRNVTWIEENGKCLDNMHRKKSLIEHAGHGAFASRFLAKGSIIAPAPLLQVTDQSIFDMYPFDPETYYFGVTDNDNEEKKDEEKEKLEPIGKQLYLNYCFAHEESTLLLCPTTNVVLINHCHCEKGSSDHYRNTKPCPNAQIEWSTDPTTHLWKNMSWEEMEHRTKRRQRGLSFDVVALRDIQPEEEICIDYGESWDHAWEEYIHSDEEGWESFMSHNQRMNLMNSKKDKFIQTNKELYEDKTDPTNVTTACLYADFPIPELYTKRRSDLFHIGRYPNNQPIFDMEEEAYDQWITPFNDHIITSQLDSDGIYWKAYLWPCEILTKEMISDNGEYNYTVRITVPYSMSPEPIWSKRNYARIVTKYPSRYIQFVPAVYKSDSFLPGVFRKPIGIRDSIFPSHWKNRERIPESIESNVYGEEL